MEQIKGNGISTFPIYHGIRFIGILSEKGIAHWMAKNMNNSIASIRDASLGNVLACQGNHNYAFIQRSTSIYDAQEIFKDQIGQGYRLDALLITDSGDSTEKLLGMITPRDIIDIPLLWK
ncbi:CBS domain-containing protein [Paracerasibacillus soli]|uniref:CBS domain-containing protein n=1 Tax=Paracerasibacillus soli TaxID=480284 RepID=A0ABU5CPA4_9BACI|nr:CBS domain-containing protein [Virgibacillus soli]MDY0407726.1 CBS domain-containing protein [Virgibacillus soli]